MKRLEWVEIVLCAMMICAGAALVISNMSKADRFAACEVRGGLMKKIDGELQCVTGKVRYAGE